MSKIWNCDHIISLNVNGYQIGKLDNVELNNYGMFGIKINGGSGEESRGEGSWNVLIFNIFWPFSFSLYSSFSSSPSIQTYKVHQKKKIKKMYKLNRMVIRLQEKGEKILMNDPISCIFYNITLSVISKV